MINTQSAYLDTIVGLATALFLLSLASSALNELLAFMTRIRSKFLWAYLNQAFTAKDEAKPAGTAANESRFAVAGDGAITEDARAAGDAAAAPLPSSIGGVWRLMTSPKADPRPTRAPGTTTIPAQLHRQLRPIDVGDATQGRTDPEKQRTTVKHIPPPSFAQALLEVFGPALQTFQNADASAPDAVQARIDGLKGTPIHSTLSALWATSEKNLARFREQLEKWFDAEMARLSGLYKRLTRWILAIAAVLIAVVVNLDPIALTTELWRDPARRAEFIAVAEGISSGGDGSKADEDVAALVEACRVNPKDDAKGDGKDDEPTPAELAARIEQTRSCAIDALEQERELGLLNRSVGEWNAFKHSWTGSWQWFFRPLKLGIVAGAIYLGAPFWYDALRRLIGLRNQLRQT